MKYILDTDVFSQLTKDRGNPAVLCWMEARDDIELYLSAVTITEIRYEIELKTAGHKRDELDHWLLHKIPAQFAGRIVPVERHVADLAGRILARSRREGWKIKPADAYIGATAMANDMTLATLNDKHFKRIGVKLVKF